MLQLHNSRATKKLTLILGNKKRFLFLTALFGMLQTRKCQSGGPVENLQFKVQC